MEKVCRSPVSRSPWWRSASGSPFAGPLGVRRGSGFALVGPGQPMQGNPDSDVDGTPRKRQRSSSDAADAVQWELENGDKGSCVYDLVGVARSKFLFKTRPRPIISKPQS
eukprot:scaffold1275_cov401-Prasinococcus_capsulatus_cf.AAC.5